MSTQRHQDLVAEAPTCGNQGGALLRHLQPESSVGHPHHYTLLLTSRNASLTFPDDHADIEQAFAA